MYRARAGLNPQHHLAKGISPWPTSQVAWSVESLPQWSLWIYLLSKCVDNGQCSTKRQKKYRTNRNNHAQITSPKKPYAQKDFFQIKEKSLHVKLWLTGQLTRTKAQLLTRNIARGRVAVVGIWFILKEFELLSWPIQLLAMLSCQHLVTWLRACDTEAHCNSHVKIINWVGSSYSQSCEHCWWVDSHNSHMSLWLLQEGMQLLLWKGCLQRETNWLAYIGWRWRLLNFLQHKSLKHCRAHKNMIQIQDVTRNIFRCFSKLRFQFRDLVSRWRRSSGRLLQQLLLTASVFPLEKKAAVCFLTVAMFSLHKCQNYHSLMVDILL